jgi:hypothetical protein
MKYDERQEGVVCPRTCGDLRIPKTGGLGQKG